MKKIILSIFALGTLAMNAQDVTGLSKGNIALTTGLGYSSEKVTGGTNSTFSISPSVVYMIQNNWGIRGGVDFSSTSPGVGTSTSNFGISAGARYFFTPANRLSFYLDGGTSYLNQETGGKATNIGLNFRPGVNYFIHNNWSMGANFNLASLGFYTPDGGETKTSLSIDPKTTLGGLEFTLMYVIKPKK